MKYRCFIFSFLFTCLAFSQDQVQDSLIQITAGFQQIDEDQYPDAIIYSGTSSKQVYVQHKGIKMWCDNAVFYRNENFVRTFGNVRKNMN